MCMLSWHLAELRSRREAVLEASSAAGRLFLLPLATATEPAAKESATAAAAGRCAFGLCGALNCCLSSLKLLQCGCWLGGTCPIAGKESATVDTCGSSPVSPLSLVALDFASRRFIWFGRALRAQRNMHRLCSNLPDCPHLLGIDAVSLHTAQHRALHKQQHMPSTGTQAHASISINNSECGACHEHSRCNFATAQNSRHAGALTHTPLHLGLARG